MVFLDLRQELCNTGSSSWCRTEPSVSVQKQGVALKDWFAGSFVWWTFVDIRGIMHKIIRSGFYLSWVLELVFLSSNDYLKLVTKAERNTALLSTINGKLSFSWSEVRFPLNFLRSDQYSEVVTDWQLHVSKCELETADRSTYYEK